MGKPGTTVRKTPLALLHGVLTKARDLLRGNPQAPSAAESDALFLLSSGFVLFTYVVAGFLLARGGRLPEASELQIYFLTVIVLPPATLWLGITLRNRLGPQACTVLREWNLRYLLGVAVYAVASRLAVTYGGFGLSTRTAGAIFAAAPIVHAGAAAFLLRAGGPPPGSGDRRGSGIGWLTIGLAVLSFFDLPPRESVAWNYVISPEWRSGLVIAALVTWLLLRLARKVQGRTADNVLLVSACILVGLSFDPYFAFDYLHHSTYVGPAIRSLHGGIPLVDAFGTYGVFVNLVFTAVFLVFSKSFFASGLTAALVNLLQAFVFLVIVFRATKNRWLAACGAVLVVWFHHLAIGYNLDMTPSVSGMRFLPGELLLLSLCFFPPGARFRWHSVAAFALGVMWSTESLVFVTGTYTAFLFASGMLAGRRWVRIVAESCAPLALLVGVHAGYSLLIYSLRGEWPLYDIYSALTRTYRTDDGVQWTVEISPNFYQWAAFLVVSFTAIAYAWKRRFWGGKFSPDSDWTFAAVMFPAAVLATLEASYYVMRSIPTLLTSALFPFGIVLIVALERLAAGDWRDTETARWVRRFALGAAIVLLSVVSARLAEPLSAYRANSTLLRRCFSFAGCWPPSLIAEWRTKLTTPTYQLSIPKNDTVWPFGFFYYDPHMLPYTIDGVALAKAYAADQERLLVFLPLEDVSVLFHLGKQHRLSISQSFLDLNSGRLLRRLETELETVRAGEVVIATDKREGLNAMSNRLLDKLEHRFRFCLLEKTGSGLVAFRLTEKDRACAAVR